MQRWAERCKKRRFHRRKRHFLPWENEAICQFRIRQQRIRLAYYHPTNGEGIQRMVRDFSSEKNRRTQPMRIFFRKAIILFILLSPRPLRPGLSPRQDSRHRSLR